MFSVKDAEFYAKHVVKADVLKPLFATFSSISKRDNLVTSAVFELLDFIKTENIKVLIVYIVERYSEVLQELQLVDVYV
jgi:hypothetical protein